MPALTYPPPHAGRENFLTAEADRTLAEMCRNASETRAIGALMACAGHKSGFVRSRVASHIDSVVEGPGARAALLANWPFLEKMFKTVAGFLNEGRPGGSYLHVTASYKTVQDHCGLPQ